jgi:hypothetical protein
MVREYGYQVALTTAGSLMRRQFFLPVRFQRDMPSSSQMLLAGPPPDYTDDRLDFWARPFKFEVDRGMCSIVLRSIVFYVPISRDPTTPIARHLRIVPSRYRLRPNFDVAFV